MGQEVEGSGTALTHLCSSSTPESLACALAQLPRLHTLAVVEGPGAAAAAARRAHAFTTRFVGALARLPALTDLTLSGAAAAQLPGRALQGLSGLTSLVADGSSARTLPRALGGLARLRVLSVARSPRLARVPEDALASLTSLACLNLAQCSLASLPHACSALTALTHLDVSSE